MFTDIFSSFDPNLTTLSPLPSPPLWIFILLILLPISSSFWLAQSQIFWTLILPLVIISQQLSRASGKNLLGWNSIISSLFILLIITNLIGLIPYTFSISSHLVFTASLGLPAWLALIISAFIHNPTKFLASLLPGGAPLWLNPFLVSIESTSVSVRPATLSFRLAANIRAGHIVIALITIYTIHAFFTSIPLLFLFLITLASYLLFEIGICFIQAFIFSLLLSLYSNDHT